MARSATALAAILMVSLSGCGGDGDGATAIDCAWLEADNCWRQTVAAAHACVDQTATGTFQSGGTSLCTFPDGVSIQFATPAADSAVTDGPPWDFTVKAAGGATCATVKEGDVSLVVTTSLGTFRQELSGTTLENMALTLTCPGGAKFRIGALASLECGLANLPGTAAFESGGNVSFSLLGGPEADPSFWSCRPPPP